MLVFRRKTQKLLLLFSLTREQIVRNNSTLELERFLSESRFPFGERSDQYIVLSRFPIITLRDRGKERRLRTMTYLGLFLRLCSPQDLFRLLWHVQEQKNVDARTRRPHLIDSLLALEERMIDQSVEMVLRRSDSSLQLVTTQSFIAKRPIYLQKQRERCERYMIWYSTNSIPILKKGQRSEPHLPKNLENYYDSHYVWNQYHAQELGTQGISKTEIKGAMLFVPHSINVRRLSVTSKTVSIFDVTPFRPSIGYYSRENCEANLRMIITACEEASLLLKSKISILLKPKRRYSQRSDANYVSLVRSLGRTHKVELVSPNRNLYQLIDISNAVISVPFTSPAILAKEANVPSVFAAMENGEWIIPENHHGLPVIRSQRALAEWLINCL